MFLYLETCFPESHSFITMLVTSCIRDICLNSSQSNWCREMKLFDHVTGTAIKLWHSEKMVANIKTIKNLLSNFLENLRIVTLKLVEFTQFLSQNLSIYGYLVWFCMLLGFSDVNNFILTASVQSISREVYALYYKKKQDSPNFGWSSALLSLTAALLRWPWLQFYFGVLGCGSGGWYSKQYAAATANSCCRDSTYSALAQNHWILKAFLANQP